ncbi:MAG: lysine--tRNA ligase [Candidatus Dependentiae bacterium]|nr:lysine--tRNA ligase [Candidatus Dependentiae bacterium]
MTKKNDLVEKNNASVGPEHSDAGSQEHQVRLHKVEQLRALGIEPWPAGRDVNATCKQVLDSFNPEEESSPIYEIAGRVLALREHGKSVFAHIQDRTGKIQLYFKQADVGNALFDQLIHFVDVGDTLWVAGTTFQTRMGEITLKVSSFVLQSKCLHPLPEKFHGLIDVETKYRQRYLDLIANHESKERFIKRSLVVKTMRNFLDEHDFVEVETPMLHPIPGGAVARPFVTHHNALSADLYLRIAPELYLKRLVIGGIERVYEINRNFRNEGISTRHNPEFTMVEFYAAYLDYHYMMTFVERMIQTIAQKVCGATLLPFGEYMLDFGKPFARLTMKQAVAQYANCSQDDLTPETIDAVLAQHNITLENKNATWGHKLFTLFEELVESKLIQPTFITEFPVEVSPLAKRNSENEAIVDRFELFMASMELSNGFNELNDPFDQAERFKEQASAHAGGDVEAHRYDADYVRALEYGLPPAVGVGIGIDRLAMVLTNTTSIKDVILFPALKNK